MARRAIQDLRTRLDATSARIEADQAEIARRASDLAQRELQVREEEQRLTDDRKEAQRRLAELAVREAQVQEAFAEAERIAQRLAIQEEELTTRAARELTRRVRRSPAVAH